MLMCACSKFAHEYLRVVTKEIALKSKGTCIMSAFVCALPYFIIHLCIYSKSVWWCTIPHLEIDFKR